MTRKTDLHWKYSARLNSFKINSRNNLDNRGRKQNETVDLIRKISDVKEISFVDLNYPQHFTKTDTSEIGDVLNDCNLGINSVAMRYNIHPFEKGAFTNSSSRIRQKAVDLTLSGIEALRNLGCKTMTIWLSQEGWDDKNLNMFKRKYIHLVSHLKDLAEKNKDVDFSIEYKPTDPRKYMIANNLVSTLKILEDVNCKNTGITIDFAHAVMAGEYPDFSVYLANKLSRLLGVHLNDCNDGRDDGLPIASVHKEKTAVFIESLLNTNYKGAIYFDTFPKNNPLKEMKTNIRTVERLTKRILGTH